MAKALLIVTCALLTVLSCCKLAHSESPTSPESAPRKRALLIGVSKYFHQDGDPADLHTDSDVRALKGVLTGHNLGFAAADVIEIVKPEQGTHASIVAAVQTFINQTQPGDIVYLHFSGHGSRIKDPTNRKLGGYCQSVIPTDFDYAKPNYNYITDLELRQLVNQLMDRKPLVATVTFDCCHAGGNTRGRFTCRGFDPPELKNSKANTAGALATTETSARAPGTVLDDKTIAGNTSKRNLFVLAASRLDQKAWETDGFAGDTMGLFTFSLVQALQHAKPETTYADLVDEVNATMAIRDARGQMCQLDGEPASAVMSGRLIPTQQAINVLRTREGKVMLNCGKLQGATIDSVYGLFPPETKIFAGVTPMGKARISALDLTKSELSAEVGSAVPLPPFVAAKAVELSHCYQGEQLNVLVDTHDPALDARLLTSLGQSKALKLNPAAKSASLPWVIKITRDDSGNVVAYRDDGSEVTSLKLALPGDANYERQLSELRSRLECDARWLYIKTLTNSNLNTHIKLEMQVTPVTIDETDNGSPTKVTQKPSASASRLGMKEGDNFTVKVRNNGSKPIFVSVIDLLPNGSIQVLYPDKRVAGVDQPVPADKEWHTLPLPYVFTIQPPFGVEQIKVIATPKGGDFSSLNMGSEARDVRTMSPIEKLFLFTSAGSREGTAQVAPEEWATASVQIDTSAKELK